MPVNFTTDLLPGTILGAMEPLSTGLASVTLSGTDYATNGVPLDFATGALRLEGQGLITNAPVVGVSTSGFALSCTLAPVPAQAQLPAGPSLVAHGTSKPGKPVEGKVVGDTLTLKGKIKNGATPFDPTKDVFVRLGLGDTDLLVVRVPAGSLVAKGKKLSASDTDGSVVHLVSGRKQDGPTSADLSSSLTLVQSKKGLALMLKQTGADLSALATAPAGTTATVRVGIGTGAASDETTVKAGAKKSVLK
jgi:hypothetical protein